MDAFREMLIALFWWDHFLQFFLLALAALVVGARWQVAAVVGAALGALFVASTLAEILPVAEIPLDVLVALAAMMAFVAAALSATLRWLAKQMSSHV